jgi:D-3-phosphoglycerate dehydrogenase
MSDSNAASATAQRILVSTTSFLDTPGAHRDLLSASGMTVVSARGPFSDVSLIELIQKHGGFDGYICGEDEFSAKVLEVAAPRAKVISKYGVGLDRIDLEAAERLGISVTNTPGVNHSTVAELTFGLLLSLVRKIPEHNAFVHNCEWRRFTGSELAGKTMGVIGLGRVGREVARRAMSFGMRVLVYNTSWSGSHGQFLTDLHRAFSDPVFAEFSPSIRVIESAEELLGMADVISLHINLSKANQCFLDRRKISACKRGAIIVNVSRGALVDQRALADAIERGHIAGYAADVLEPEPASPDNPLIGLKNVHLTPHIGSRTIESVVRQGCAAVKNLLRVLQGA